MAKSYKRVDAEYLTDEIPSQNYKYVSKFLMKNQLHRINYYLQETFPVVPRLFLSFLLIIIFSLRHMLVFNHHINWFSIIIGSMTLWCMLLYYRLCDEFKDKDTDAHIFPHRPIPSGKVFLEDLSNFIYLICITSFVINAFIYYAYFTFLLLFIFLYLMGKWFYLPKLIGENRILAFTTHSPSSYLYNLYAFSVIAPLGLSQLFQLDVQIYIICLALPGFIWKLLRKTFAPSEERPGYQTYSSMLGIKGSLFLIFLILIISQILSSFYIHFYFPYTKPIILIINLLLLTSLIFFFKKPEIQSTKKRSVAECYSGLLYLAALFDSIYGLYQ